MILTKANYGMSVLQNCKLMLIPFATFRQASRTAGQENVIDDFRVLNLKPKKNVQFTRRKQRKMPTLPPRSEKMAVDQHWPSVWPGPRTFHPAAVPLPLHQGFPHKKKASPGKFGNAELMKIPNFLHLTPPAIKQQCEALKKFCTEWPKGLDTPEQQQKHFPIEISTSTYCHSSASIRDPLARIVTMKIPLKVLPLDAHAKDKLLRLVRERFDPKSDMITLVADRCPLRKQNEDYVQYLLTALFHESWKVEPWESEKELSDMEVYVWEGSISERSMIQLVQWSENRNDGSKRVVNDQDQINYKEAVESLFNCGEDIYTINKYKDATMKLVSLQS